LPPHTQCQHAPPPPHTHNVPWQCRMSPWSAGRAVATSDQLNRYLSHYATPTPPPQPPEGLPAAGEPGGVGQGGGGVSGLYGEAGDQGPAASPALPLGRDAPAYRPSLVSIGWLEVGTVGGVLGEGRGGNGALLAGGQGQQYDNPMYQGSVGDGCGVGVGWGELCLESGGNGVKTGMLMNYYNVPRHAQMDKSRPIRKICLCECVGGDGGGEMHPRTGHHW